MAGDTPANAAISFETAAVLVAAIEKDGTKLSMKHFQMMAELDGSRTKSSFEHEFRKIKQKAREINGEETPAPTPRKKAASGTKRKGGKKDASEDRDNDDSGASPIKKPKVKDEATEEATEDGDGFWDQ
ncbi:hypothetical protein LTS10_010105 [Elasticomyces elasticus]|nr:hypothetical protein LTS10_010105 [Elasticomyces elasticus]